MIAAHESPLANVCPICKAPKGKPCRMLNKGNKFHRGRLGFIISSARIDLLRAEKALLEKQLCDGRKNMLQHYRDELWTVNEALRFAGEGEGV